MENDERITSLYAMTRFCRQIDCQADDFSYCEKCFYKKVFDRLLELENKIEQGTLIELPCKVGDTVYVIYQYADFLGRIDDPFIEKETAKFFIYDDNKMKIVPSNYAERDDYWYKVLDILLTREEAEKRLKELKNG